MSARDFIDTFYNPSVVEALSMPSLTLLGCVSSYIYTEQKGIKNSAKFLEKFFPNRPSVFYFRLNFFLSVVIGTCIGEVMFFPSRPHQAIAAGIGWMAAFTILTTEKSGHSR